MSSPYHRLIGGTFIVVGKEPDGDSVRFVADDLDLLFELRKTDRRGKGVEHGRIQSNAAGNGRANYIAA